MPDHADYRDRAPDVAILRILLSIGRSIRKPQAELCRNRLLASEARKRQL